MESLARNKVNLNKVITHWPNLLRVAGSLVTGQVRAYDLLRIFGREGRPTPLGQAFAEYGRIGKTLHLLRVVDLVDGTYRRQMNRQPTVQESRHKLARDICHGKRGQIMQAYRDGQEDQLGALGLVLNAVVLWPTRYLDASVEHLRALPADEREHDALDEARVSPLRHANLNVLGRYTFRRSRMDGALRGPAAGLEDGRAIGTRGQRRRAGAATSVRLSARLRRTGRLHTVCPMRATATTHAATRITFQVMAKTGPCESVSVLNR